MKTSNTNQQIISNTTSYSSLNPLNQIPKRIPKLQPWRNETFKNNPKAFDFESVNWEDEFEITDDSECSDVDVRFDIGEEDYAHEDLFEINDAPSNLEKVNGILPRTRAEGDGKRDPTSLRGVDDEDLTLCQELEDDSDDLVSLQGSDEEGDNYPVFNKETDFKNKVKLCVGLKFSSNTILRKALSTHAIENRYDYYYSHNDKSRITAYCRYKCKCKWDKIKARIVGCNCKVPDCSFKVHATKMKGEETLQIKSMNLRHSCFFRGYNKKVTSEYLAERYLEDWRENPDWKLEAFQKRVYRELGVAVKYGQCSLARARAKLMLYGDGADQYARVWDYVTVIRKYNPGSSAFVMLNSIETPPPIFQRMYICLKPCKDGFLAGCRPLIGVDGCHLKGPYPGMILVAVGKDGNNSIYPIAWAVVEVENRETWCWFLNLLVEDLDKEDGNGLTFMSDRQKGLLEAFSMVTPKSDIRFCVRHIWANFKLQFAGQAYKEPFWKAARSTSKAEFDAEMEGIKSLNPNAHSYLAAIPAKHWSRHAFSTNCKSNMLLNNVCESFNAVLKDARDKPILTLMEWIRRYVMKRNCEKRERVLGMEGNVMPYVEKYLKWAEIEARFCLVSSPKIDEFEVDYRGKTWVVDLKSKKCGCFYWELSGIPCPHAMACILKQRGNPELFVDEAYYKAKYMMAYEPSISAMPCINQWERIGQQEPMPPPYRKMPCRPNSRKRRKEVGEGSSKQVKRVRKSRNCGRCGQLGHNSKTCKNPPTVKEKPRKPPPRPRSTSEWSKKVGDRAAKRKTDRELAAQMYQGPTHQSSQASSTREATFTTGFQS